MYHKRIKNAEQNTTITAKNKIEIISSNKKLMICKKNLVCNSKNVVCNSKT